MKRSRLFLILVLILLVINTLFFVLWYGFDGKGKVQHLIEKEAGKALKGDFKIDSFAINDRQAFAENITFKSDDGNLSFTVDNARVRFNLFKFIFSGFRINHILNEVTITKPTVRLVIPPSVKEKKPPKKIDIPDLRRYFNDLSIKDGSLDLDLGFMLSLGEDGVLNCREKLSGIQISVNNHRRSNIKLEATPANGGTIVLSGYLDKGRLGNATASINSYKPLYVGHPMLKDVSTELSLSVTAGQETKNSPLAVSGQARLWNTRALVLDSIPIELPFIVAESNGDRLSLNLSQSSIGSSSIAAQATITGLQKDIFIRSGSVSGSLDLGMLDPTFRGIVSVSVKATGPVSEPSLTVRAGSEALDLQGQSIKDVTLTADYSENQADFKLENAVWENHAISAVGNMDIAMLSISAKLGIKPQGTAFGMLRVETSADVDARIGEGLPDIEARFETLSVHSGDIAFENMAGYVNLISTPGSQTPGSYYVDCDLESIDGQRLTVLGDVLDQNLVVSAEFATITLADLIPGKAMRSFSPRVKGTVDGFMTGNKIVASTGLYVTTSGNIRYNSIVEASATYDLATGDAGLILNAEGGRLNEQALDLQIAALKRGNTLSIKSLRLNDDIGISADLDMGDIARSSLHLMIRDISTLDLQRYIPEKVLKLPQFSSVTLLADYDPGSNSGLQAYLKVGSFVTQGLKPLYAEIGLRGPPNEIEVYGSIANSLRDVLVLDGSMDITQGIGLRLRGLLADLSPGDILDQVPISGGISGEVAFSLGNYHGKKTAMTLSADVSAPTLVIPGVPVLNDLYLKARHSQDGISIDSLSVHSGKLASINGSGTLDYDLLTGEIGDGWGVMRLQAKGDLLPWLNKQVQYITDASGSAVIDCEIGTSEGQFRIASGNVEIRDGYILLKDQSEPIRDISLRAVIADNRVQLQNTGFRMGNGKAEIVNYFDDEPDSHFLVGFLDLGCFRVSIPEPGIQANVPFFTAPRSLSSIILTGQSLPYATITGPFDDMRIAAKVIVSEADALYPPDTANLLNLISSFRGALSKPQPQKETEQETPLPFSLDLVVQLQDNVKYTTYPARLNVVPGSFLHITYEDQEWVAREANFNVDRGSIDFLGTVFQAEYLDITILDAQNVFVIDGSFYKRSPDGTIVTLSVTTNRDTSLPLFDRLEFNLTSDNPQDRNISQILARLGSTGSSGNLPDSNDGDLLQDEALNLISDNLNTSILSPFLYPIENQVRRLLKLDGFSIKAGFIQNLFMQYTTDPNQIADYMDMQQFMDDITRFSSSILLNNLSISASKYLGRKMFLDYQLSLQEATDLQKKTRILVTHDTSLRLFLPSQFKLAYTFKYEPMDNQLTHEVMLQRSFRFWGL